MTTNGTNTLLAQMVLRVVLVLVSAARFVRLVFLACAVPRYTRSVSPLPGVPKLEGLSFLGVILLSMRHGASEVVARLLDIATDGISYASVAGNALVFVHDTAIVRQLLAMPEGFVSRQGAPTDAI
jgi:hypothetical protein